MKKALFECVGGNTFKLVNSNPTAKVKEVSTPGYSEYEPVGAGEEPTGDINREIDDVLARFNPEDPDPEVYDKLLRIQTGILNMINNAESTDKKENLKDLYASALRKLSIIN